MKPKNSALFLLFLLSSASLFSYGVKEPVSKEPIVFRAAGLKGPSGLGMAGMISKGLALPPGYEVVFETAGSPDIMVSKLLSGEVSAAALPLNVAAKLYTKGAPYILGAVTGYGSIYVVSSDRSIGGLADLKGKTVYNAGRGATPDFLFRYLAEKSGFNPDADMVLKYTAEHTELAQLLIAGKAETGVLPEPFVTMVLSKNPKLKVAVDLQKEWTAAAGVSRAGGEALEGSYPITAFVISKDLAYKHGVFAKALLEGLKESIAWVLENPGDAGKVSEEKGIGFPAALAEDAVPRLNLVYIPASLARPGVEEFLSVFAVFDPDSIGGSLPDEGFYYAPGK